MPLTRSAEELSQENPGSGALSRGNFRSAAGGRPFNAASRKFSNLGPVESHAPPVMTREEHVAREVQEREISAGTAQDKTEAANSRFAQAISHVDVTDFAQLSSDAQPRPTSKTLVTRSSQPVPNAIHYAPLPENDDPDACPNLCVTTPRRPNSHDVFTSGDLSVEITRLQDEVALCRKRLECLDQKRDVSLAEHKHNVGRCIGRSRISRKASSAAASDKQPPQKKSPYIENWRWRGTLQA